MTKLPHWIGAYKGVKAGFFGFMDSGARRDYSHDERRIIYEAQRALLLGVSDVYNFNTRDYAYEQGGMTINLTELDDYDEREYP